MGAYGKDISGKKFNRLLAIEKTDKRYYNNIVWKCKCDCGNEKEVPTTRLISGYTKSCGCLRNERAGRPCKESGYASLTDLYKSYKERSKVNNRIFNLTRQEFKILTSSNCYYCNAIPTKKAGRASYNGYYIYNGIDRVDNDKGYILNNCVSCCTRCNHIKRGMPIDMMKKAIDFIDSQQ